MAVIGSTAYTFADWATRFQDGKLAAIVELLSQSNPILEDMLVVEANTTTGHKTTVRTGLPASTWRLLNYGVPTSKSTVAQVVDAIGNLEAESQIDRDFVKLNGNTPEFRLSESRAFIESMNQTMAQTLVYGNTATNPERFMGFAPRYNTVNSASAQTAINVIDAGGTGSDNTSAYLVVWGADTVHGIFPKGSRAGLQHEDMDLWRVYDSNNNPYWAYVDHYKWELGLTVRDWRYVVRICNIDVSDLSTVNAANLFTAFIRALHRVPTLPAGIGPVQKTDAPSINGSMGRAAFYVNRTVASYLDIQAVNKTNALLSIREYAGVVVNTFRGIPIRPVDAILNTEARIT